MNLNKLNRLFFLVLLMTLKISFTNACDNGYALITSVTDLGGGVTRYTFRFCTEFNGPTGEPPGFGFAFSPATVNVVAFTPASVSTSNPNIYTGAISGSDLFWSTPDASPSHSGTILCFTGTVDVTGIVSSIIAVINDSNPDPNCNQNVPFNCLASPVLIWD